MVSGLEKVGRETVAAPQGVGVVRAQCTCFIGEKYSSLLQRGGRVPHLRDDGRNRALVARVFIASGPRYLSLSVRMR